MTEIGTVLGFVITGVAGLVIGYLVGSRRAPLDASQQQQQAAAPSHPQVFEPRPPRQRTEAYSLEDRAEPPRRQAPARPIPAQRTPPPAPVFVADTRPDDDRTVFRKLKSAREAFQESKDHLDQVKEHAREGTDDAGRFGGTKKE